ncbi:MAG: branched-chain amino acid ABC transporter permease [Bradyrhizobiaceae bacterium]|nr:branched-chain amino acid ABC transporter permease [Bradyrhizobiaceae bacterium]
MTWINQVVQGVLLGGYYAVLACGLSLMFGVMRIINLAHGDLVVLAAFIIWLIVEQSGASPFVATLITLPVMALIGWALQRGLLERSLRTGMLVPVLTTFGLAIVLQNAMLQAFGADMRALAPQIGDLAFAGWAIVGEIHVGQLSILIFVAAVLLLGGLHIFLRRTAFGRQIRATAEDADVAELVGVNARATFAAAAALATATTALAGALMAMRAAYDPYSGPVQLIFAFEAVVIGGIGSIWGTLVGGIVLGVAQSLGAQFHAQGFLLAGHAVFLAVLAGRLLVDRIRSGEGLQRTLGLDS